MNPFDYLNGRLDIAEATISEINSILESEDNTDTQCAV